jgi:hypothetical protein
MEAAETLLQAGSFTPEQATAAMKDVYNLTFAAAVEALVVSAGGGVWWG